MKPKNSKKNSKQFKFYIPKRLPGLNEIIKWSKTPIPWLSKGKRKVFEYTLKKNEYEEYISRWILKAGGFGLRFEKAKIDFVWFEENRRRDPSNVCAGGRKFILDALVTCGTLVNDNWLISEFTDKFLVDKKQVGVEVTITEK